MDGKYSILLVEDEEHIAQGLTFNLEQEGYSVTHAPTGREALNALESRDFALLILDLMLPDMSGLDICRSARKRDDRLPILILTALGDETHRVAGLQHGADDYLTKPFSLAEFLLRVRRILERSTWYRPLPGTIYRFGPHTVNLQEQKAMTPQGEIELTEMEVRILRIFFSKAGEVLDRGELLESVWNLAPDTETRAPDNFIARLRKYFEADPAHPEFFLTVRGKGYRFENGEN
jgi:DNA-binding response OmpR family regulator